MARPLFGTALLGMLALGCGDSGNGAAMSSVPASKKLSALTQADLNEVCNAHKMQLDNLANPCVGTGLGASSQAECQKAYDACEMTAPMKTDAIDCTSANTNDLVGCDATIGDFESCLNTLASYLSSITCANYAKPPAPPSCFQSIQVKCPSLFGDSSSSSSSSSSSAGTK